MTKPSALHKTHPDIIKRLKRVEGHLRSTIAMIEQGRPCLDIAQQLHAVEKAIAQAKKTLVHDHIDHCLERAVRTNSGDGRKSLEEFKVISKYL
jgi:DNA-binding FrmR family transcriptional regulator